MERNRHAWIGGMHPDVPKCETGPMGPPFNSLIHRDDRTGKQTFWAPGEHAAPEEPVFVPRSADAGKGRATCCRWSADATRTGTAWSSSTPSTSPPGPSPP
jgi:carotenoid cleavage dioxygenase-like enzyme